MKDIIISAIVAAVVGFFAGQYAGNQGTAGDDMHKVVIQVSDDNPRTQKIALNNAANVQKAYGDKAQVEVVAYGPGLSILTMESDLTNRVASMAEGGVTFSACGNTMKKIEKKKGSAPTLTEGVKVVPAGVGRIMELQEAGYSYVRP
jgi:intracellular sulfur oxidation DsrE/DsrF family protein